MRRKVELHRAYFYTCEECGIHQYVHGVTPEFSEDEAKELREEHGIPDDQLGGWEQVPDRVICTNCHTEFGTIDPAQTEDEP